MADNKEKKGLPLVAKILFVSLIPMIVLFAVAVIISVKTLDKSIMEECYKNLKTAAQAVKSSYNYAFEGEFTLASNGDLMKGNTNVSANFDIVDSIFEETDINTTIFYRNIRKVTSLKDENGERIIGTEADPAIYEKVYTNGDVYKGTEVITDKDYYVYYEPLKLTSGDTVGMVFAGRDATTVKSDIRTKTIRMISILIVIFAAAAILIPIAALSISRAIKRITDGISTLSGGDLTVVVNEKALNRSDEIGKIARSTENLITTYKNLIGDVAETVAVVKTSADSVSEMSTQSSRTVEDVSHAVEEIAVGASSQADETQAAAENVDNIGRLIQGIVDDVKTLSDNANIMGKAETDAMLILNELDETAAKTNNAVERIAEQTAKTNESAMEIRQAVELITSIASQTNLLSLNASIEAARAGEAGRGFAVVASEIQQLAEQSNSSAVKISEIIGELTIQSEKTLDIMKDVKSAVAEQEVKLGDTKNIFAKVKNGVDSSMESIDTINARTDELDEMRGKIVEIIQDLSAVSEENAAATQETTASTEELASMMNELASSANELNSYAVKLENAVSIFKTN